WKEYDDYCYWKGEKKVSFDDGVRICKEQNANLVSIKDEEEYKFLTKLTKSHHFSKFWIGGRVEFVSRNKDNDDEGSDNDDDDRNNGVSTNKIYWVDNTTFSVQLISRLMFGHHHYVYYGIGFIENACFSLFTDAKAFATEYCKDYSRSGHSDDNMYQRCVRRLIYIAKRRLQYRKNRKSDHINGLWLNNCTKMYYPICKRSLNEQTNKQLITDLNEETLLTRNIIIDHNLYENYIHKFVKLFQSKSKLLAQLILLDDAGPCHHSYLLDFNNTISELEKNHLSFNRKFQHHHLFAEKLFQYFKDSLTVGVIDLEFWKQYAGNSIIRGYYTTELTGSEVGAKKSFFVMKTWITFDQAANICRALKGEMLSVNDIYKYENLPQNIMFNTHFWTSAVKMSETIKHYAMQGRLQLHKNDVKRQPGLANTSTSSRNCLTIKNGKLFESKCSDRNSVVCSGVSNLDLEFGIKRSNVNQVYVDSQINMHSMRIESLFEKAKQIQDEIRKMKESDNIISNFIENDFKYFSTNSDQSDVKKRRKRSVQSTAGINLSIEQINHENIILRRSIYYLKVSLFAFGSMIAMFVVFTAISLRKAMKQIASY
ncbi:hypothetical protein B4U80_11682, partial [Leptotrombidium deliense]